MGIAGGGPGSWADVDAAVDVCCGGGDGENSREQMGMAGGTGGKFGSFAMAAAILSSVAAILFSAAATSSSIDVSLSASSLGCTITTTLAGPVPTATVDFFLMTTRSVTRLRGGRAGVRPRAELWLHDLSRAATDFRSRFDILRYSVRRIRLNGTRRFQTRRCNGENLILIAEKTRSALTINRSVFMTYVCRSRDKDTSTIRRYTTVYVYFIIIIYYMDAALYGRGHGNNKRRRLRDRSPSQSPSYSCRRRRRRDARRAMYVVRVRARCVGVGLVYRAPVAAAATKAARAGGCAVLERRTYPVVAGTSGGFLYRGGRRKKLVLPRRDRLFRSSSSSGVFVFIII